MVGSTDSFAYRKPIVNQPCIVKAIKGNFGRVMHNFVRTARIYLDAVFRPNKANSPYFAIALYTIAEHGA